jgi:pyridoxal 5'-phosphate synthase pdxS subunit
MAAAKELGAPYELVKQVAAEGKLPVPNFAAGGVATPADAALMMALGAEAVFVGSGIFKSGSPAATAETIVQAVTHWNDPKELARIAEHFGTPMRGLEIAGIPQGERLQERGW